MTRRRDGFAGLSVVPDHVETTVEVSDARAAACREAIVTYLRGMADLLEAGSYPWVERPATVVVVLLGAEDAAVSSAGDLSGGDVDLFDASQCILAFRHRGAVDDVQAHVAETRAWRVQARRDEAAKRREYERERPYVCGCGERCKSAGGLTNHMKSHLR